MPAEPHDDDVFRGLMAVSTTWPALDLAVAEVRGEIDAATSSQLEKDLTAAMDLLPRRVLVDLAEVTFFSSRAMTVLLRLQARCADSEVDVVFVVTPALRRLLGLVGLQEMFTLLDSRDEALAHLTPRAGDDDGQS
ncbi:STAS domain-containing protein [Amycolatopsis sp. NPDC048633]|uniref:STAS domain-containing protein n=1 Tax=Amycolatopsis sp. NPDC048633 TaxID=3157095 RepID=UPI0033F5280D